MEEEKIEQPTGGRFERKGLNDFQRFHNEMKIRNRLPLSARISPERLMEIRRRKTGKKDNVIRK